MRMRALFPALGAIGVAALAMPAPALAADAAAPYSNVDHRNDAGNDTGDRKVDRLNAGQLDEAQPRQQAAPVTTMPGSPPLSTVVVVPR